MRHRTLAFACALSTVLALGGIAQGASRSYTVVVGDTLSDIALRYDCPLEELMLDNELVNDHIVVGHRLKLPDPELVKAQGPDDPPLTIVEHVIEEGDSLGLIAVRYRTTVRAIRIWNVLSDDRIKVGQSIEVPAIGQIPKRERFTYSVEPGDTIRSIAERFTLPQRVLKRLNRDTDFTRLKIGDEIVVYRDVYVDPPTPKPVPAVTPAPAPTAIEGADPEPAPEETDATATPMPQRVSSGK